MKPLARISFLLAALLATTTAMAQWERYGGVYAAYPAPDKTISTPAPNGYTPIYISMFARHGSRWLPDEQRYDAIDSTFADTLNLTALGKDVRRRLAAIHDDARGRAGGLTATGARQHRDLARRMAETYPEVFCAGKQVHAQSSTVLRCAMSMTAFVAQLGQMFPQIKLSAETGQRYMAYIAYTSPEEHALEDSTHNQWTMQPERLMQSLFINPSCINARDVAQELHTIASDMQNTDIGISLYDIFTESEMRQIYDMNNRRMQLCNGINTANGGTPQRCAASLWKHIVESADNAIATGNCAADLLFGHDTSLYRLLSRLGLYADENRMDVIIPMAANLQMVFYGNAHGKVIVKFMQNEREITLPAIETRRRKTFTLPQPYYYWDDVKHQFPIE